MLDLHCHILPEIDDGAKDLSEAQAMLKMQHASSVEFMFLTPHFYPENQSLETFLTQRAKAWDLLSAVLLPQEKKNIRLGAEVHYCQQLIAADLSKLTLGNSCYLLLELPVFGFPAYLTQTLETLLRQGIIPILAHVERYSYFRSEPNLLKRCVDIGALTQVTAQALFDKRDKQFSLACLQHGLAQIVASDAHNLTNRKPNMNLLQKLPSELMEVQEAFTMSVWENDLPPYLRATNIKKTLFGYR